MLFAILLRSLRLIGDIVAVIRLRLRLDIHGNAVKLGIRKVPQRTLLCLLRSLDQLRVDRQSAQLSPGVVGAAHAVEDGMRRRCVSPWQAAQVLAVLLLLHSRRVDLVAVSTVHACFFVHWCICIHRQELRYRFRFALMAMLRCERYLRCEPVSRRHYTRQ